MALVGCIGFSNAEYHILSSLYCKYVQNARRGTGCRGVLGTCRALRRTASRKYKGAGQVPPSGKKTEKNLDFPHSECYNIVLWNNSMQ